ncbi:hypothetical protein [Haladaptatus litoreus]|uniref:hypothetical protein n=1 Tax=Haladaptatus litoreus TaxID=553468 RepID=UPI000970B7FE|nr:hypothetical protein [Haladaptatus litoreus]
MTSGTKTIRHALVRAEGHLARRLALTACEGFVWSRDLLKHNLLKREEANHDNNENRDRTATDHSLPNRFAHSLTLVHSSLAR